MRGESDLTAVEESRDRTILHFHTYQS